MKSTLTKETFDVIAAGTAIGTVAEVLPPLAAGFAIIWTTIRIYEWARVAIWKKPPRNL